MREFLLPPNILTVFRLILLGPAIYYMSLDTLRGNIWCLFWISAGMASDMMDGHLARKYGMITDTGKILDPLIDKATVAVVVLCLEAWRDLPLWLTVMIVGRDIAILLGSFFVMNRYQVICQSNWLGKLTVFVIAALIFSHVLGWDPLKAPLQVATAALLVASTVTYGLNVKLKRYGG